jgi:uncharacterized protein (DUF488 family)
MQLFTLGFAKKPARQFFALLQRHGIRRVIDIRANNRGQLAGFTKRDDLEFFLHALGKRDYAHHLELAPTQDMLRRYRAKELDWKGYEGEFKKLMAQRGSLRHFDMKALGETSVLLCSEPTPEHCHRRLVAEGLKKLHPKLVVTHI